MFLYVLKVMEAQIESAANQGQTVKEFRLRDTHWNDIAAHLDTHPFIASEIPGAKRFKGVPVEICELRGDELVIAELSNGKVLIP
ncbi:hypothetical protein [Novosphingobium sp. KA1]|uniref:hypothetical protein n=1 Tax=Novosphingobium sp. (strain KA1) TaxID=164608 RepID=UPI001A8C2829|nr:hypothetical protein [Novosphingobium sp. KA1]QSR16046.1 hypothetical protein CA833_02345 [Novosphingobium sp. KA1]